MHSAHSGNAMEGQQSGDQRHAQPAEEPVSASQQAPSHRPDGGDSEAANATDTNGCHSMLAATWNIAAVNNNPFEYWVTHSDPAYNEMMLRVQDFIDNPGDRDTTVGEVLTDKMFEELVQDLTEHNFNSIDRLRRYWVEEYRERKLVSGFLKDRKIGSKRLASMPDRVTNTIYADDGSVFFRPTAINCFEGEFESKESWWAQWRHFMFNTTVQVFNDRGPSAAPGPQLVCHLLEPILKEKYKDITPEEEAMSLTLQTLCLAIFDAILIHMLDVVAAASWQHLRRTICEALYKDKDQQIVSILTRTYPNAAVVFLQEVAASFVEKLKTRDIHKKYMTLLPSQMDGRRDQNSIILASRSVFVEETAVDVTDEILKVCEHPTAPGDLVASVIQGRDRRRYMLVSFHGETNGLATRPVVAAVDEIHKKSYGDSILIFGLDANTYREHSAKTFQGVENFHQFITERGIGSCWGSEPDPLNPTTCNARTYLQPQLNKAVGQQERIRKADKNLKDWIMFYISQTSAKDSCKDNTGSRSYIEEMVFPTLDFPSDHAVVSAALTFMPSAESEQNRAS
mmetsp:Transcript_52082/g.106205  ORF Transcript_52082/g.106205 Transcript_52082/m.106205 type:complete len:568 (+) Transcript_52082:625-2328(+)